MILNLPYGGIPVDDYIYQEDAFEKLYEVHLSLISLLKNGIIPMNQKNVYHNDIKDSNVLVEKLPGEEIKTRLIDWGLASEFNHYLNTDILMASGLSIKNSNFDSIIITNFGELNVLRGHLIGEPAYVYYITKLCNNHMTSFSSSFDNIIGNILIDNLGNAYKIG